MIGRIFPLIVASALGAGAQAESAADRAMAAARALEAANESLQAAISGRDQIAALTQTIQSYEDGMVTLRDGLRAVQLHEAALAQQFSARGAELSRLLSVLMATDRVDESIAFLHPDGALETARAAMILSDVAPELAREVADLRESLEDLSAVRRARQFGLLALEQGLATVQEARVTLSQAISDRGPLPQRFSEDPAQLETLARSAATLSDFAEELAMRPSVAGLQPARSFRDARGQLEPPVRSRVLHAFNQPDAAGIAREGMVLATLPEALVTSPWSATVRFSGPLAGHGLVVILEPVEDILLVLGGLGAVLVESGEILPVGTPIGTMPEAQPTEISTGNLSQTLYFEMRERGQPIDPKPWFAFTAR